MFQWVLFAGCLSLVLCLQCRTNCSMNYSMQQSFVLPLNCTYIIMNQCSVKLTVWYERDYYRVTFPGESSIDSNLPDDRYFIMIEIGNRPFFVYDINYICKDADDCTQRFIEKNIIDIMKYSRNFSLLYVDLRRVLYRPAIHSHDLACFDTNEVIRQCSTYSIPGSCQIIYDLVKHKYHRRTCQRTYNRTSTSINIYDTTSSSIMTIACNRMLCNGPLTILAVKNILYRYRITDSHGRLLRNTSKRTRPSDVVVVFVLLMYIVFLYETCASDVR
jgi:hypothetical protein